MKRLEYLRRRELHISQAELARRANLNPATVCQAESGRFIPYDAQLARLKVALCFTGSPSELLEEVTGDGREA